MYVCMYVWMHVMSCHVMSCHVMSCYVCMYDFIHLLDCIICQKLEVSIFHRGIVPPFTQAWMVELIARKLGGISCSEPWRLQRVENVRKIEMSPGKNGKDIGVRKKMCNIYMCVCVYMVYEPLPMWNRRDNPEQI